MLRVCLGFLCLSLTRLEPRQDVSLSKAARDEPLWTASSGATHTVRCWRELGTLESQITFHAHYGRYDEPEKSKKPSHEASLIGSLKRQARAVASHSSIETCASGATFIGPIIRLPCIAATDRFESTYLTVRQSVFSRNCSRRSRAPAGGTSTASSRHA